MSVFQMIIPELFVMIAVVVMLFAVVFYKNEKKERIYTILFSFLFLLIALCGSFPLIAKKAEFLFSDTYVVDSLSSFAKIWLVLASMWSIWVAYSNKLKGYLLHEYCVMVFVTLFGAMILTSASNLLVLYIGIETLSIISFAMAALGRNSRKSVEAGLKYAIYGGVSSAIMLFGMAHLYGVAGSLDFNKLGEVLYSLPKDVMFMVIPAVVAFMAGLLYKIGAFPLNMWVPDVYEGSPTPVTTFFSLTPKIAGIVILLRVSEAMFTDGSSIGSTWQILLAVVAALTMTSGNITAINQSSMKRLLAYSSIAHAGFLLICVVVNTKIAQSGAMMYLFAYIFMNGVVFAITNFVEKARSDDSIENFSGLIKTDPFIAILMIISLMSLAGVPPFLGFIAKFKVLSIAIESEHVSLAVIGVLNSVVALYYYLKVVMVIVFGKEAQGERVSVSISDKVLLASFAMPIVVVGIFWNQLHLALASIFLY